MSVPLLVFFLADIGLFLVLFWAARPRVSSDHGPFRLDERMVRRVRRSGGCPYRSMDSARMCTRRGGHRGVHDVEGRALVEVLRRA